jgi:hypothetical protein
MPLNAVAWADELKNSRLTQAAKREELNSDYRGESAQ